VPVTRLFDIVMVFVYRVPLLDCLTRVSQGFLGILVVGDYRLGRCEIGQLAEERAHVIILVNHGDKSRAETHGRVRKGNPRRVRSIFRRGATPGGALLLGRAEVAFVEQHLRLAG
jgi:hypothetical protein